MDDRKLQLIEWMDRINDAMNKWGFMDVLELALDAQTDQSDDERINDLLHLHMMKEALSDFNKEYAIRDPLDEAGYDTH